MGVFTAPAGSMKDQLEELGGKVEIWANLIVNGYLHRRVVRKEFWGTIWRTIVYHLPVMMLTEGQGEWLTKELYRKLLPEFGVNQNLPQAYQHVFTIFQGMGLPSIMVEQTVAMVSYCMIHGTPDRLTGYATKVSL